MRRKLDQSHCPRIHILVDRARRNGCDFSGTCASFIPLSLSLHNSVVCDILLLPFRLDFQKGYLFDLYPTLPLTLQLQK